MAGRFLVPDRGQSFLRATSYRELLGDDELVWTVIEVIEEKLDLSGLYARYPETGLGPGRRAYDPAMMLKLLVFGYCEGKRSSRELETACRRDDAYRAICGGMTPDHATIARFRVACDDVIEELFVGVLAACVRRGLVDVGKVALDGTKIEAAASKAANRSAEKLEELTREVKAILAEVAANDTLDNDTANSDHHDSDSDDGDGGDDGDGDGGSDDASTPDSPPDPTDPAGPTDSADAGDAGVWSMLRRRRYLGGLLERLDAALCEIERARQVREADLKRRGRKRTGPLGGNLTDPDSRLQETATGGFIQGYNAQAMVTADQIVIAAILTPEATDVGWLGP